VWTEIVSYKEAVTSQGRDRVTWFLVCCESITRYCLFMVALWNRADHYIFALWFLLLSFFFPRLISAVADWISAILPHTVWPYCEFRMQVWNLLDVARWNTGRKKVAENCHLGTIAQFCRAISSQLRHVSTIRKIVRHQYLLHMSSHYGEIRPTDGWDRLTSLGHPCKFQLVSRLGSVTARHLVLGVSQTLRRWT